MAAVGIVVGFNAPFQTLAPKWIVKLGALTFLMIAIFIFLSAQRRACRAMGSLEAHKVAALAPIRIKLMAWSLTMATIALGSALWFLT